MREIMKTKKYMNEISDLVKNMNVYSKDKVQELFNPIQEDDSWTTDITTNTRIRYGDIDVYISPEAKIKIDILMDKFDHTEWLAYLIGNINEDSVYIDDIVIPKQEVTVVNVFVDPNNGINVETIGVIHSHHDMGNEFSHTDDEFINANHNVSLCVTHKKIKGHVRVKVSDNEYGIKDANIVYDEFIDFKKFIDEIEKNISPMRYVYSSGASGTKSESEFTYPAFNADFEDDEFSFIVECVADVCDFIDRGIVDDDALKEFIKFLLEVIDKKEKGYDEYSSDIFNLISSEYYDFSSLINLFDAIDRSSGSLNSEEEKAIELLIKKIESYFEE